MEEIDSQQGLENLITTTTMSIQIQGKKHTQEVVVEEKEEDCIALEDTRDYMSELPRDVLMKILVTLGSIKTIVRCKLVRKSWLLLMMGDPYFARLHLSRVEAAAADCIVLDSDVHGKVNIRHSALLDFQDQDDGGSSLPLIYDIPAALVKLFSLKYTSCQQSPKTTRLVGSCNGLLCFIDTDNKNITLFVSNLLTREYVVLPSLLSSEEAQAQAQARRPFGFVYGFGFSHKTNQYKVIQIFATSLYSHSIIRRAKVHTLGSGVWRNIGIVPYEHLTHTRIKCYSNGPGTPSTYLNGILYWVSSSDDGYEYNSMIFSFDFDSEQFRSLPSLPDEVNQQRFHSLTLGVLGDRLCVVFDATIWRRGSLRPLDAEIWVLKDEFNDFGSSSSSSWWAKEVVIKFAIPAVVGHSDCYLRLIKVLKTGEILFRYGFLSVFYNPRDESCSRAEFIRSHNMVAHVPSFVSLKDVASGDTWEVINAPYKLQSEVKKGKSIEFSVSKGYDEARFLSKNASRLALN